MKRGFAAVVVLAASILGAPHDTDAGKKKKRKRAEVFVLHERGTHETKAGVEVRLEPTGHGMRPDGHEVSAWRLVAEYDGERSEAYLTNLDAWAELPAFGSLLQVTPLEDNDGVSIAVKPLAVDQALEDDVLEAKVAAEADKRRVVYTGSGARAEAGVSRLMLGGGGFWAVRARIGQYSGAILTFDVDPYATIRPTLLKGAKAATLPADGTAVAVGGVTVARQQNVLTIRKGKKEKVVPYDGGAWVETIQHSRLLWMRGDEIVVASAKKLKARRRPIAEPRAIELAQADADARGIYYDGASATASNGVIAVTLTQGTAEVVRAVIGAQSRRFLRYDVIPPGVTPEPEPEPEPTVEPEPTSMDAQVMQAILDEHNRYRADHCAPALTWSDELAASAQAWAEQLRDMSCAFEHSNTKYGENLAGGTPGSLGAEDVVGMWYREVDEYDFARGGFSMATGHFTQVVWKGTKRVGCGLMPDCNGMDLWVCQYDPPGNYEDQFKKNVLPTSCR